MTEQIWGPFEKFVVWRHCAGMLLFLAQHNSGLLPPLHELFKWPSYIQKHNQHIILKLTIAQLANKFPTLMKPEGSLPCSCKPANGPYRDPDESNPHPYTLYL
jgi:hypothetical protein